MENDFVKFLDEHPDLVPSFAFVTFYELLRRVVKAFINSQGGLDK